MEATFDWTEFLESNKAHAVPEELFLHVEASLNNGIKQGMFLEVCHKTNPDIYWIAEITLVCGHLLRIKFIGAHEDFWCDISTTKIHPLGWCGKYEEQIDPPDDINETYGDKIIDIMAQALSDVTSVSVEALNNKGLSPIDRIKSGMKVEVQNTLDPYRYWIATVSENVGGRLLLRYDGSDEDLNKFWIFFSNPRLSSFGFVTNKGSPWQFKYPGKVNRFSDKNKLSTQLRQCAEESIKDPAPSDLFQPDQSHLEAHNFVTGMKLEALDPQDMKSIHPATVTKIFNNFHFLVVIDDHIDNYEDSKMAWMCDSLHPYIYPIGWAENNKIPFTTPKIWKEPAFDWDEYLSMTSSVPAPEYCFGTKERVKEFEIGMKLEAVNPRNHEEIHVASVNAVAEHMIGIDLLPIGEKIWCHQKSDLLFPVGWCDSNNYELHIPDTKIVEEPLVVEEIKEEVKKSTEEWCDRIFFNYKCYSGPSISRNKLSQLPKHVGPGPLSLVLKEVLNKIISASYKPAKLLKDWETEGPPEEGMRLEMLKAKLKNSTYHAYVPIATSMDQVSGFCRGMCGKLQACPCLFGPVDYSDTCPETCQQVDKSRFQTITVERRGRPKGSFKRKKKKGPQEKSKEIQPSQESNSTKEGPDSAIESEHSAGSTPPSESGTRPNSPESHDYKTKQKKKREPRNDYPKLEMKTRGAKLPNFALQIKQAHWDKKALGTTSNKSTKKRSSPESETESSRSTNSRDAKNISDVSDNEEPELKKLKFSTNDPLPSDNKTFESMSWMKGKLKLSMNPMEWSIDDVHTYLSSTDCKLIADKMRQEEIDGEAFIMLDLPVIREFLHLKKEYALQLCKHITMIRWYYIVNFEENHCDV